MATNLLILSDFRQSPPDKCMEDRPWRAAGNWSRSRSHPNCLDRTVELIDIGSQISLKCQFPSQTGRAFVVERRKTKSKISMIYRGRLPVRKLGRFRIDGLQNFDTVPRCRQSFKKV